MRSGGFIMRPVFDVGCTVFETYDDIETCLSDEGII